MLDCGQLNASLNSRPNRYKVRTTILICRGVSGYNNCKCSHSCFLTCCKCCKGENQSSSSNQIHNEKSDNEDIEKNHEIDAFGDIEKADDL